MIGKTKLSAPPPVNSEPRCSVQGEILSMATLEIETETDINDARLMSGRRLGLWRSILCTTVPLGEQVVLRKGVLEYFYHLLVSLQHYVTKQSS